jgi:hypothetical protein
MPNRFSLAALALAAALALPALSQAATVTLTHDYGIGGHDPAGNDRLGAGYVMVKDQSTHRFSDSFNWASLGFASIDSLALTLDFSRAGPSLLPGELWKVRVQGSAFGSFLDDMFMPLASVLSPQTLTLDLGTDTRFINAFAHSVATQTLTFWFSEFSPGGDGFRLNSAALDINGTFAPPSSVVPAVVPLPATGLLLLGALGV